MKILQNIIAIVLVFVTVAFSPNGEKPTPEQHFLSQIAGLDQALANLKTTLDQGNEDDLSYAFAQCRKHLKEAEILLAYYFEAEYNLYINAAPLPKLELNVPEITVLQPVGMQVLDELVYSPPSASRDADISQHIATLRTTLAKLTKETRSLRILKRHLFEALRSALVRSYALGLSSFDTPSSGAALSDAYHLMQAFSEMLSFLEPQLTTAQKQSLQKHISTAQTLLNNGSIEDFDFAAYLRQVINPLYSELLDIHLQSGVEHAREVSNQLTPINYYAAHLFDADFLNLSPFSKIDSSEVSPQKISLGRSLFFDTVLSQDRDMTCATCHDPALGFADGKAVSTLGEKSRNSPTLINAVYATRYFHDLRTTNLNLQMDHVVYHADEFNTSYDTIIERLSKDADYAARFAKAYPRRAGRIDRYKITNAMTQYVASLTSMDSQWDRYARGESEDIAPDVKAGFNLFMGKGACATCHFVPLFNGVVPPAYADTESEILGVTTTPDFKHPVLDQDPGRMANGDVRQASEIYARSFKTPTIRNIEVTAPYMHNGAYTTLDQVLEFYNAGGGAGMGLDVPYQTLPADSLGLSSVEMKQIITFMHSLTSVPE